MTLLALFQTGFPIFRMRGIIFVFCFIKIKMKSTWHIFLPSNWQVIKSKPLTLFYTNFSPPLLWPCWFLKSPLSIQMEMNPEGTCVTDAIGLHIPEPGSSLRTWFLVFPRVSFSPGVPQLARTSLDILQPRVCRILASLPSWSRLYQGWSKHEHPLYSALPGGCPSHHSSVPAHALEMLPHQTPVYGPIGAGQRASGRGHHAGISSGLRDTLCFLYSPCS